MVIAALVHGTLHRAAESRMSKAGKPYVMATLSVKEGEVRQFVQCFAFGDTAQAELLRLSEGEALAVQGALKAEVYTPAGGEPRVSLSIFSDNVLALRQPPRERKAAPNDRPKAERRAGTWRDDRDGPNDQVPF
jgi:single-stranded DNA-binding protein